jgi:hypothetical protein
MISRVDSATTVHLCAYGPVLLEVRVIANDRGRVYALFLPDFICATVSVEGAVLGSAGVVGGVVIAHCE